MTSPAFEFRRITKHFGAVVANDDVSFEVGLQTIHGVVGENGAGKSTIMKVLYGLYSPDSGETWVHGKPARIDNPFDAIRLGIGMVHQHFMLVPTLSVWQNIILGREPSLLKINKREVVTNLERLQKEFGFSLDLDARVETLPVGHQQQVEILTLLYREADILILDEPTAVLTPQEVAALFERLRALQTNGKTIVLISHKLKEILSFTGNVTVMRRGKVVETRPTAGLDEVSLASLIIGRETGRQIQKPAKNHSSPSGAPVLKIEGLTVEKSTRGSLHGLSFDVKPGEIVGIAGVEGNGQDTLIEVLSTVNRDYAGKVFFCGEPLPQSTYAAKQAGLAVIPPDRHREGLILDFSVQENFILGHHREEKFTRGVFLSESRIGSAIAPEMERFDVRPRDPALQISSLSGGNQQKVIIGRELSRSVKCLLASHPTRGVDIGAIEFIHAQIVRLRDEGAACLLISSELDEILALSDRILVLFEGRFMGEVSRENANESKLGLWMTGGGA